MADDWQAQIQAMENMVDEFDAMQKRALMAAAEAVVPALEAAAPERVDEHQGGKSMPQGALKANVRPFVRKSKETGLLQACLDFGRKYSWIAYIVDRGHRAPFAKFNSKFGKAVGRSTPAKPFIRAVKDSSFEVAQAAYAESMAEQMTAALKGK